MGFSGFSRERSCLANVLEFLEGFSKCVAENDFDSFLTYFMIDPVKC